MLTKNVNETVKKKSRLGCFLIDSGQTGKSIYTAICLVQYWLQLKVDGTALKLTVSKVREVQSRKNGALSIQLWIYFYRKVRLTLSSVTVFIFRKSENIDANYMLICHLQKAYQDENTICAHRFLGNM